MNKDSAQILWDKINEYENIIIAKHIFPDWDALGSAEGLRNIINDNFKNKNVFVVGSLIDADGKIDDDKLTKEIINSSLLITVDTANIERVDFEFKNDTKEIFRIDHHINDSPYSDYEYIFPDVIACTQIITLWATELKLNISKVAAEYLYKGLITDSGRFAYKSTDEKTFDAAKILVSKGIDIAQITRDVYKRTLKQAKWMAHAFSSMKIMEDINFAYCIGTYEDKKKYDLTCEQFKSALGSMSNIEGIDVWSFIYQMTPDSRIKISLRSNKIDINKLAVKYGGGGHKLASGGYLDDWSELELFLKYTKEYIKGEM